jgi:hypothetical protein
MDVALEVRAFDALSRHDRIGDLASLTRALMQEPIGRRSHRVSELAAQLRLLPAEAETPFGNALDALARAPTDEASRALVAALAAHALSLTPTPNGTSTSPDGGDLLRLGATTLAQALRARTHVAGLEPVVGEVTTAARGPIATTLLACTGILLLMRFSRLFATAALAYRTPAEVVVTGDGAVRVNWRVEMLGRRLVDREVLLPRSALLRAVREVRYPGLAFHAGLLALAVGSYLGVSACVDGVRAASPSLLAAGLCVVALGLAVDFALSVAVPGARGTCVMVFVSRDGKKLCVRTADPSQADALMAHLRRTA